MSGHERVISAFGRYVGISADELHGMFAAVDGVGRRA